jgi:signal transduction histidine kinase
MTSSRLAHTPDTDPPRPPRPSVLSSDFSAAWPGRRAFWVVGAAAAGGSLALTSWAQGVDGFDMTTVLVFLVGCSFFVSGMVAWSKRENRLGPLMVLVGLTWFARPLTNVDSSAVFTAAIWLTDTWFLLFALFLLSLPYGRLTSRLDVLTLAVLLVPAIPLEFAWLLFFDTGPPGNALLARPDAEVANAIDWAQRSVVFAGSVALAVTLWRRWFVATPPLRRILIPALVAGCAVLLSTVLTLLAKVTEIPEAVRWIELWAFIAVPVAVLTSIARARLARSSVADVFLALEANPAPGELRDALARALDDTSVQLAFWLPEYGAYADLDGRRVELPDEGSQRAATIVERVGAPVAALIHDASLREEPDLLAAVAAAAGIALENARLHSELRARLEELRGSRARVIEVAQRERQRLERDLHDGAQQRLIALSLELSRLEGRLRSDPTAKATVDQARREISLSLAELRDVARGIHPAVVSGHGLEVALEQLAARASIPVRLTVAVGGRLPERIEVAAFYLVSESLTNIAKHSGATSATVGVAHTDGQVVVEVVDDGVGGADTERGSGLRGLADRVEALEGRLRVWSPSGGGTKLRAEIPCGS